MELVAHWAEAPESLVVVEFEEVDGGTRVSLTQGDFDRDEMAAPYVAGWEGGLDKLVAQFSGDAVRT